MMNHRRLAYWLTVLVPAPIGVVAAQCPEGTPPPCARATASATIVSAARRPLPAIDDRTWIVVPFDNVARSTDIDWLKDASVNLLYLDMSRWRDVRVVDDERVADLIREVGEARPAGGLTLQSGIAVAKRAGAGRLVMGDLLKIGARTQIVGKVFDVRTGQRLRTVRQDAATSDSIIGAFGRLARGVLDVSPPSGTSMGSIGTTSVGAYQAYLSGVGFLNRWLLDSARTQFTRAITLDTSFALAHYKLAVVSGWQSSNSPDGPRHANQALRHGTNLPPRERELVTGYAAFANNQWAEACRIFEGMVRRDSTDVEGWYNLGECSYHDPVVVPAAGDTSRLAFRSSWNVMRRAFARVLELDPTYHLAFQHIHDALLATTRSGCRIAADAVACTPQGGFQAVLLRAGDSLVTVPVNSNAGAGAQEQARQAAEGKLSHVRRQNLIEARRAAEVWLSAGPNESRPRVAYARILLRLGQVERADSVSRLVRRTEGARTETFNFLSDRAEIAVKQGRFAEASRLIDSIRTATDTVPGARNLGLVFASVMGKTADLGSMTASMRAPDFVKRYFTLQIHALVGLPADGLLDAEKQFSDSVVATQSVAQAATFTATTLLFIDPRSRGGRWPALDTTSTDARVALMAALATGDSARSRRALVRFDSIAGSYLDEPDNGFGLVGAFGHLMVADTLGALASLRRFRDVTWRQSSVLDQVAAGFGFQGMVWPRTFLLLGDLAAARGHNAEAAAAYRQFVGMWERADPELQPMVQRAREALARITR